MTAAVLTYGVPWPLNSGARIRDEALIRRLAAQGVAVHLVCCAIDDPPDAELGELPAICASVTVFRPPRRSVAASAAALVRGWEQGRPAAMLPFFFPELRDLLRGLLERTGARVFQIEHSFLAGYHEACSSLPDVRTALTLHNLGWEQYARIANHAPALQWPLAAVKARLMRDWEAAWAQRFDVCITVSHRDAELLRQRGCRGNIAVIENGVDCERLRPLPFTTSTDLLFAGVIGYPPNADAVEFFCRQILPRVRRQVPEARLLVVGHAPPARIRRLACESVMVTGTVPDMVPWYDRCRLSVVPLRAGGGTRLKILESMALGRPVVSTRIGCEGIEVTAGDHLLVADEPDAFADGVVRLLRDDALWHATAARARERVEAAYSWIRLGDRLHGIYAGAREETTVSAGH